MRIGIAGPIGTDSVAKFLGDAAPALRGREGAPFLGTLIGSLLSRGHEVIGFTLDSTLAPGSSPQVFGRGRFRLHYVPARKRSIGPSGGHLGRIVDLYRLERRALVAAMQTAEVDVVHAHWTYEFALAAIESGVPNVVTVHDSPLAVLRHMPNIYRFGRYLMARRALRSASALTAVSEYMRDQVQKWATVAIDVVANPLPDEVWSISEGANRIPAKPGSKIALVSNGWGAWKNGPSALKAFAAARLQVPHLELHAFGQGFERDGVAHQWCRKHRMSNSISFYGPTPHLELLNRLADMDVMLHSSLEESFGMSVAEGMALGLAVVGGRDSGAIPWLLDQGAAGLLVDVTSPSEIANALRKLATEADTRRAIAAAARARARKVCDAAGIACAYIEQYERAIALASNKRGGIGGPSHISEMASGRTALTGDEN